jgi:low affinity Fe/Cu permease
MKRLPALISAIYVIVMIAVVVSVDIAFFQHHTEWRLFGNIAVIAIFLLGYLLLARSKK